MEPVTPATGAGSPAPMPMTGEVSGRVVDFSLQPMETVQVSIGSTTLFTDAEGKFRIPNVAPTYDATLVINTVQNGEAMRFVWRYEGLTRRDPTLQAYSGRTPHGAWLDVRVSGVNFMNRREGDMVLSSYGGVTGEHIAEPSTAAEETIRIYWEGPAKTRFTGHAFRMLKLPGRIEPNDYYAYASVNFEITAEQKLSVDYNLAQGATPLPWDSVTGTLDGPPGTSRTINMYMRFPDNAVIPLMTDPSGPATFSYGFPISPPGATIILVARQDSEGGQLAHVDNIDKNTDHVAITLPPILRLVAPPEGAVVDANTSFQWAGEPNVYLFWAQDESGRDAVYVVTTKREARLPQAETYVYQPMHKFAWGIEAHGTHKSLDEVAGPQGFLDTVATLYRRPSGPIRGKGTLATSRTQRVSIKP